MTAPATVSAGTKFMVSTFRHREELPVEITSSASVDGGASAMIFKGTLKFPGTTPITVALKVFPILLREHEQEMLRRELRTSSKVSHKSVLPFIGTAVLGGRTIIVSPFMKNGNLLAYARAKPRVDRRLLIKQVAEAVNFLHVHERVVHGDLKCENVLISDSGNALVSDFGLSTVVDKEESSATTMTAIRSCNTPRFAAPELLLDPDDTGHGRPRSKTRESDVYAFAMLLLQAFTGKMPWPELRNEAVILKVANGAQHARPGGDALHLGLSDKWWAVCLKCWKLNPRDRPSMLQVCNQLEEIRGSKSPFNSTNTTPTRIPAVPHPPIPQQTTNIISPTGLLGLPYNPIPQDFFKGWPDVWNPHISIPPLPPFPHPMSVMNSPGFVSSEGPALVVCVAYDSRTRRIIYATNDHSVHVVEPSTGLSLISPLVLHKGPIYALCLRPTSRRFFSCSDDHTIIEWRTVSSSTSISSLSGRKMRQHSGTVTCMALSTDGNTLVSGSLDCTLRFWDSETRDTIGSTLRSASGVLCVAFSPDSSTVASGSEDGMIRLWTVSTGTRLAKFGSSMMGPISCLSFAPGGRRVISVSRPAQSVHVWSISSGEIVGHWQPKISSPGCIAISPSGQRLAYHSSVGGEFWVCDAQSGQLLSQYTCAGHCSSPAMSFSPNNESLAVCYHNGSSAVVTTFEPMRQQ